MTNKSSEIRIKQICSGNFCLKLKISSKRISFLIDRYNATIVQKYSSDTEKLKILIEALRLAEKVSLMIDGSFSWFDTSITKHYERSEGHQLLVWKGRGYKTILDVLMKKIPNPAHQLPIDDKIILNKQVSNIFWANKSSVIIKTLDNAIYSANHVIFTPSVGVLKEEKEKLFTPSLPKNKLDAIEAIGIAGVMKIILHFEQEWWRDNDIVFAFLWSDEDLFKSGEEFPYGPIKNNISWVSAITVFVKVPGNPNVLVAWVTGNFIPEIEKTEKSVIQNGCIHLLRKFFGKDYNVTEPNRILT